jgi:hypothetical protein
MSGISRVSSARVLDCLLNTGIGLRSELREFRAGNKYWTND